VALKASLLIAGDASGAVKAAEDAARAMDGAEAEAKALASAYATADASIAKLAAVQAQATGEINQAKAALAQGKIGLEQYNLQVLETKAGLSLLQAEHRAAVAELRKANSAYDDAVGQLGRYEERTRKAAGTTDAAAFASRNLNYQLVDTAQGLAMGAPPLMVLMQQLPQAADAFGMLASESGGAGAAIGSLAGKFGPAILAAGAMAGAVALITAEVNENQKVQVGWQDVLLGTYDTVKQYLEGELTSAFAAFGLTTEDVFDGIQAGGKFMMNTVIGSLVAIPKTAMVVFGALPGAVGDAFYSAVNLAIDAVNWLIEKSVGNVNYFVDAFNAVFDTKIPRVVLGGIDDIENPFKGAMAHLGAVTADAFVGSFTENYAGEWADAIGDNSRKRKLQRDAEKTGKDIGSAAGKAAGKGFNDDFAKAYVDGLDQVEGALDDIASATMETFDALGDFFSDLINGVVDKAGDLHKAIDEQLLQRVDALTSALGQGGLGGLLRALTTRDRDGKADPITGLLGMGGIGSLVSLMTKGGQDAYKREREAIEGGLTAVFGKNAEGFAKTVSGLLQGAGTGSLVGSVAFGSKSAQTAATAGGALGQAAFEQFAGEGLKKALGAFGGPLASIATSLLSGVLAGALSSTKKGRATFSGDGFSTSGNSQSRIGAASDLAGSVLDALHQIADAFGADVGSFTGTIGVRKDSIRYNPTGTSLKDGLNFGQDSEAALKAVIGDAISDGVFSGLSDGIERLLRGGSDVEAQLQKALSLKGALDENAQRSDGQAFDLAALDKQFGKLRAIATEAGEGMAEVEELYAAKRKDIVDKYAQEAIDKLRPQQELQLQIYTMEGKIDLAKGLQHEMELQGLNEVERALQIRLFQLESEAELAAKAKAVADERYALQTRLYTLLDDQDKLRARELATISEANQPLLQHIYALEDQKAATEAAAQAAEDAAQKAKAVADEKYALETQLLQLDGDKAALAQRELAAVDPLNRSLAALIQTRRDEAAATEEEAQRRKAIADEAYGLETRYLEAIGDTNALRQREIAALAPENQGKLRQIYAVQDALTQQAAAQQAAEQQRSALTASYQNEAQAMGALADRMDGFAKSIVAFRDQLVLKGATPGQSSAAALATFRGTARLAALGNEASLSAFTGDAQAYLDVALKSARTFADYQDAVALVAGASNDAVAAAQGQAGAARSQAALAQDQIARLDTIVAQADDLTAQLEKLNELQKDGVIPAIADKVGTPLDRLTQAQRDTRTAIETLRLEMKAGDEERRKLLSELTGYARGTYRGGSFAMSTDADRPIAATVSGEVRVNNAADDAVQVNQVP
jgi:hypothetical protein